MQFALTVPAVKDRVVQAALKLVIEPIFEHEFEPRSYGFRPGLGCKDALREVDRHVKAGYCWVVDADLQSYFDSIPHSPLLARVAGRISDGRVLELIQYFLKQDIMEDMTRWTPTSGSPQGAVVSPILANLFLHYAFDKWMQRHHEDIPFERHADDAVCHCHSLARARMLVDQLRDRFAQCGLELHPQKTRVVYCKDADRRGDYPDTSFDFLGFTFRPRLSKNRHGKTFVNFSPAVSVKAAKSIRQEVRSWNLQIRSDKALDDLARMFNATIRGWVNYYGAFYKSALYPTLRQIDRKLVLWATRKFKRLRGHRRRASHWLERIARKHTRLFAHWPLLWGQASVGRAG
ncbi:hypothetical protein R69746_07886 [Paraburkholderia aspalathi]|uniref:group II intron reverse transcriptase/maturase n=1 Tax=Paraburkholderia aspalathi TaxID=1324617 RepID=UPI00190B7048|nr:group II intron reverse transcriptase/maturase [Paraburkholderia aspalathi]MBK3843839.1 group II intron reverse transcriptase/maturase [Paraburkholderia aspalathi]CAE6862408.1 hypothetical protein R69746_07886 [Paraburkholderia aspalathi]